MAEFREVVVLKDPDGVGLVAPITVRDHPNGFCVYSFAIFKEYTDSKGEVRRTNFLNKRHIGAAVKLLRLVSERLELEHEKADRVDR